MSNGTEGRYDIFENGVCKHDDSTLHWVMEAPGVLAALAAENGPILGHWFPEQGYVRLQPDGTETEYQPGQRWGWHVLPPHEVPAEVLEELESKVEEKE